MADTYTKPKRVLIISHSIKLYRVPFFDHLYEYLKQDGIELTVIYGETNSKNKIRKDNVDLPPEYGKKVPAYWLFDSFVYYPILNEIRNSDLVVIGHHNKYLLNLLLYPMAKLGLKRVAFWDRDSDKGKPVDLSKLGFAERVKYKTRNMANWWFAYTEAQAQDLRRSGVTCGITWVNNAVDTSSVRKLCAEISDDEVREAKAKLGIAFGPVAIYCGTLARFRRLEFLVEAATRIRAEIPDFHLIVVGPGERQDYMEEVSRTSSFIHYLGPQYGRDLARALRMADVFLVPAQLGLSILDAFAGGLPLITAEHEKHSVELGYLENGVNGILTEDNIDTYVSAILGLLQDPEKLRRFQSAAKETGQRYTIEHMAENFRNGIQECLAKC